MGDLLDATVSRRRALRAGHPRDPRFAGVHEHPGYPADHSFDSTSSLRITIPSWSTGRPVTCSGERLIMNSIVPEPGRGHPRPWKQSAGTGSTMNRDRGNDQVRPLRAPPPGCREVQSLSCWSCPQLRKSGSAGLSPRCSDKSPRWPQLGADECVVVLPTCVAVLSVPSCAPSPRPQRRLGNWPAAFAALSDLRSRRNFPADPAGNRCPLVFPVRVLCP